MILKNKKGILMTEQEAKRLEDQIKDLQSQIDHYRKDKKATEIIQEEENLLGRCFKATINQKTGQTEYFKPISLLHHQAPYMCHGIKFTLPLDLNFAKRDSIRLSRPWSDFDYIFEDDLILYCDTEEVMCLRDYYTEISEDEFEAALATLMLQVTDFSKKPFTVKKELGEEYEKKILGILSHKEQENKNIPEEN